MTNTVQNDIKSRIQAATWYHTVDLGNGLVTPGMFDHRPYLGCYGLPKNLHGKTVLDIGVASGFFAFEFEKRGASVLGTELPHWLDHDFGPCVATPYDLEQGERLIKDPFSIAHQALQSKVQRKEINIYDISPETTGKYDLTFCGSVLVHLTDPIKALWRIRSVTKDAAIISTVISESKSNEPVAQFVGDQRGMDWWLPNKPAFEAMVRCAGFSGWDWFSEFRLDYSNGKPGPYHAVLRAWTGETRPEILNDTDLPPKKVGTVNVISKFSV